MSPKLRWPNRMTLRIKTFKTKLVIYLMLGCMLPLVLLAVITYYTTYSIMVNKIETGIGAALKQEATGLENTLNNLMFASKQFAVDGQVVEEVFEYLRTQDTFHKSELQDDINKKMNIVNYTNPNLGLMYYYLPGSDTPVLFENLVVTPRFDIERAKPFTHFQGATFFGPHKTFYSRSDNLVFSLTRNVSTNNGQKLMVYLETNFSLVQNILNDETYGLKVSHVLMDRDSQVVYMKNTEGFTDTELSHLKTGIAGTDKTDGFRLFTYKSEQGWELIAAIREVVINSEIHKWFYQIFLLLIAAVLFALILAYLIWRSVYGLLRRMNREMINISHNVHAPVQSTRVEEFDVVLNNFKSMKQQIAELISTAELNEKRKSELEIEKLLSQINPHFLHNTLNTVQWLARMNGQKEIHRLVTLLVKVLQYNLGKQSIIVTVADEVEALRNYIELQRIRYDYEFDIILDIDSRVLGAAIPHSCFSRCLRMPCITEGENRTKPSGFIFIRMTAAG